MIECVCDGLGVGLAAQDTAQEAYQKGAETAQAAVGLGAVAAEKGSMFIL
jgi:hypothetical protein